MKWVKKIKRFGEINLFEAELFKTFFPLQDKVVLYAGMKSMFWR